MKHLSLALLLMFSLSAFESSGAQNCDAAKARTNQLTTQVKELEERIALHQKAIKDLNLDMRADEVGEWAKLGEQAKRDAKGQFLGALLSTNSAFTGTEKIAPGLIRQIGSLKPYNVGRTAKNWTSPLRGLGINTESIEAPLRKALFALSLKKNKDQITTPIAESLSLAINRIGLTLSMPEAASGYKDDKLLEAAGLVAANVLSFSIKQPALALLVADFQLWTGVAYGAGSRYFLSNVNKIASRTESDLKSIASTFKLMKDDVSSLQTARQQLENARQVLASEQCRPLPDSISVTVYHSYRPAHQVRILGVVSNNPATWTGYTWDDLSAFQKSENEINARRLEGTPPSVIHSITVSAKRSSPNSTLYCLEGYKGGYTCPVCGNAVGPEGCYTANGKPPR